MYRKNSIYRIWYLSVGQALTGGFEMYPPKIRGMTVYTLERWAAKARPKTTRQFLTILYLQHP
jgi:hypothetical protein